MTIKGGNVDPIVYEKPDYVKYTKTQPKAKVHYKVGKSTDEIRKDDQWAYSCRLAQSRAKAMAIVLSIEEEFKDIDEVLIVVGPKFDVKVRLEADDEGELIREVFMEEYIPHVPGRYGRKGNVMCITVPVEERDKKVILDSGSGHDFNSRQKSGTNGSHNVSG